MRVTPCIATAAICAATILQPATAQAAGAVCLTDTSSRTICVAADQPSTTYVSITVLRVSNTSPYAAYLKPGSTCLNPGASAGYPGGRAVNVVQVGPGSSCPH